jgi:hypothetical protein
MTTHLSSYCVVNARVEPVTWTCVITADEFHEGGAGEHIEALVSTDRGYVHKQPAVACNLWV